MVATLAVACAIGYGLDWLFGIHRWFLLGFVPVGIAAGVRNMMRFAAPEANSDGDGGGRQA